MIFQALHKFAKEHDLLSDVDFTPQKIGGYIALTREGSFQGVFSIGEKKSPIVLNVSKIPPRNSAAIPALGADTIGRIVPKFDPKANVFAVKTQGLFNDQLKTMQTALDQPTLPAVTQFLDNLHEQPELQEKVIAACVQAKLKPSEWITFKIEGEEAFLIEWPEVKEWWRQQAAARREETAKKSGETSICMVTGQPCIPMRTHGANIKVAPGGLAGGVALVSCDKSAFSSYGFDKALVSPMSEEAVEGYIRAINHLGTVDHHHYRTKDTNYLFWSSHKESSASPAKLIETGTLNLDFDADNAPDFKTNSSAANVAKKLFTSISAGNANAADNEGMGDRYYCLALSGNSARGIIRNWIDQPLPNALQHVSEWFEDLSIRLDRPLFDPTGKTKDSKKKPRRLADPGEIYNRWPLWQLINSLKGKGDSSDAEVARQRTLLWQCALLGRSHPVPAEVLITACRRIATTGDCPPARAALIQFLVSRILSKENPSIMHMNNQNSELHSSPAFLSGRLLRILNSIQTKALESVNASLVDKFYAAASATPSSVLGTLIAKSNPHLSKIRSKSPGLAFYFEEQLTEVIGGIVAAGGFKATHSPIEQGQFALGFYFQRVVVKKEKPEADDVSEHDETSGK